MNPFSFSKTNALLSFPNVSKILQGSLVDLQVNDHSFGGGCLNGELQGEHNVSLRIRKTSPVTRADAVTVYPEHDLAS